MVLRWPRPPPPVAACPPSHRSARPRSSSYGRTRWVPDRVTRQFRSADGKISTGKTVHQKAAAGAKLIRVDADVDDSGTPAASTIDFSRRPGRGVAVAPAQGVWRPIPFTVPEADHRALPGAHGDRQPAELAAVRRSLGRGVHVPQTSEATRSDDHLVKEESKMDRVNGGPVSCGLAVVGCFAKRDQPVAASNRQRCTSPVNHATGVRRDGKGGCRRVSRAPSPVATAGTPAADAWLITPARASDSSRSASRPTTSSTLGKPSANMTRVA